MSELYKQSIEKLTAAQMRGFESVEALKRQHRLEQSKGRAKSQIAELLNADSEESDANVEVTEAVSEQLVRRRQDQEDVSIGAM